MDEVDWIDILKLRKESAQNVPAPVTTYALFRDGQFLTQGIQSDKKFLALAGTEFVSEGKSE